MEEHTDARERNSSRDRSNAEWFCTWFREGAEKMREAMSPPEDAEKHFREARLEVLRGIRELVDYRIQVLSKQGGSKGTRVVVD